MFTLQLTAGDQHDFFCYRPCSRQLLLYATGSRGLLIALLTIWAESKQQIRAQQQTPPLKQKTFRRWRWVRFICIYVNWRRNANICLQLQQLPQWLVLPILMANISFRET